MIHDRHVSVAADVLTRNPENCSCSDLNYYYCYYSWFRNHNCCCVAMTSATNAGERRNDGCSRHNCLPRRMIFRYYLNDCAQMQMLFQFLFELVNYSRIFFLFVLFLVNNFSLIPECWIKTHTHTRTLCLFGRRYNNNNNFRYPFRANTKNCEFVCDSIKSETRKKTFFQYYLLPVAAFWNASVVFFVLKPWKSVETKSCEYIMNLKVGSEWHYFYFDIAYPCLSVNHPVKE